MINRLLLVCILVLLAGGLANGAHAQPDQPVASVNGSPISRSEFEAALQARVVPTFGSRTAGDTGAIVLRELIKERLAEQLVSQETISGDLKLSRELDRVRRQILLNFYITGKLPARPVGPDDIARFASENPQFFAERKTYHFSEVILSLPPHEGRDRVLARLEQVTRLRAPPPSTIQALVEWLELNKYMVGYSKLWMSSEQLSTARLDILSRLDASQDKSFVEAAGDEYRLVALHGAYLDPLDPVRMRSAIVQSLSAKAAAADAEALITNLLASADIRIYDKSVEGLDLPPAKPRAVVSDPHTVADRIRLATLASMLCLTPVLIFWLTRFGLSRRTEDKVKSGLRQATSFAEIASWIVAFGWCALLILGASQIYEVWDRDPTLLLGPTAAGFLFACILCLVILKAPAVYWASRQNPWALGAMLLLLHAAALIAALL